MCGADEALRRGLLLGETRREVATTFQHTQTHTDFAPDPKLTTYAELLYHASMWPESTTKHKEESRCKFIYTVRVCARVCVDIIKCFVLYCAHTIARW